METTPNAFSPSPLIRGADHDVEKTLKCGRGRCMIVATEHSEDDSASSFSSSMVGVGNALLAVTTTTSSSSSSRLGAEPPRQVQQLQQKQKQPCEDMETQREVSSRAASSAFGSPPPSRSSSSRLGAASTSLQQCSISELHVLKDMDQVTVPRFNMTEILHGKFLGQGGFSEVHEITRFRLKQQQASKQDQAPLQDDDDDDDEALGRNFLASNCARHATGETRYAIKFLRSAVLRDPSRQQAGMIDLVTEAQFLTQLQHPNIVKLRGVADSDPYGQSYFLILDRLYDTLEERVENWHKESKKASRRNIFSAMSCSKKQQEDFLYDRLVAAYDLSAALAYLHRRRIVHRDVKPSNCGFDVRGDIRLFDFGLARELPPKEQADTGSAFLMSYTGTPRFLAPEVGLRQPYNEGCDVYAFSLTAWTMLSLTPVPFQKELQKKPDLPNKVYKGGLRPTIQRKWPRRCKQMLEGGWHGDLRERLTIHQVKKLLEQELLSLNGTTDDAKKGTLFERRSTKDNGKNKQDHQCQRRALRLTHTARRSTNVPVFERQGASSS